MSKTILITRAPRQAEELAREMERMGFETFIQPMLQIHPVVHEVPDMKNYEGLIVTSAESFNHFDLPDKSIPIFTVGPQTEIAARVAGFENVISAGGAAKDVEKMLEKEKTYLHVRGRDAAHKFPENVHPLIVYEAALVQALREDCIQAIQQNKINMVTFFSTRTAENFIRLMKAHDLEENLKDINSLSISDSVLNCVRLCVWKHAYSAETPDRKGMMDKLKDWVNDEYSN